MIKSVIDSLKKDENRRLELENSVHKLHLALKELIFGNYDIPKTFIMGIRGYNIILQRRLFTNGWVDLLEISEKGDDPFNPTAWPPVEGGGTTTVNLPPEKVVKSVLEQLIKMQD